MLSTLSLFVLGLATQDAQAKKVTVPVDVGVGPAAHFITGPMQDDQLAYAGLALSVEAVLNKRTIKKFRKQIPKKYRQAAMSMDEVRVSPSILIPDTLFISPKVDNTGMYGVSWRPIGLGIPLAKEPVRWTLGAGLRLTYAYVHSDTLAASQMHFIRPGLDAATEIEVPLSKSFLVSFGWNSQLYIPQEIGGDVLAVGELDESIWHIGQGFLKLHFRFPYAVDL